MFTPFSVLIGLGAFALAAVFETATKKGKKNAHADIRPELHGQERLSETTGNPAEETGDLRDGLQPDERNGLHEER